MKQLLAWCCLVALLTPGCVSKSKSEAQARAAYLQGQREAMALAKSPSVWVIGNVKSPAVPWTADLTLTKAIVTAEYRGSHDPSEIIVTRQGQPPLHVRPQQLLQGQDMPLQAGDQIEIRP